MKLRRITASVLAVGVCALLLGAGIVRHQETASWQTMITVANAHAAERLARESIRPVLWGRSREGAAFTHYEQALRWAEELPAEDGERFVACIRRNDAELAADAEVTALRRRWRPVIDAVRAGAHCLDARPAVDAIDAGAPMVSLRVARDVVNATILEARTLRDAGRHVEAVERTLDGAAFGADLVHRGILVHQMLGVTLVRIATAEAWPDQALRQLDEDALEVLATGLARLDDHFPCRLHLADELAFLASQLRRADQGAWSEVRLDSWRYGFSQRWMAADAFLQLAQGSRELDAADLPWPARRAALDQLFERQSTTCNPIVAASAVSYRAAEEGLRECATRLRLLRLAVECHRGAKPAPLQDPLGDGPLAVEPTFDGVRISSASMRGDRLIARTVQRR